MASRGPQNSPGGPAERPQTASAGVWSSPREEEPALEARWRAARGQGARVGATSRPRRGF
eukprot:395754-Pyramimonas_sp.AAC.1